MTKKKWLGALLNFLVAGLGNVYGRNIKKGILVYFLFWILLFTPRFVAYNFTMLLIAITIQYGYRYVYLLISGYREIERDKVYEPAGYDKWYIYVFALVFHWTLILSIAGPPFDKLTPINWASIPTPAMEPTLQIGDKLAYKKTKAPGRNDVVIFRYPNDTTTLYVKRCIGLPGDTLQIKAGNVFVNGTQLPENFIKSMYDVVTDGTEFSAETLEKNNIKEDDYNRVSEELYYFYMTAEQADHLKELSFIDQIERGIMDEEKVYPDIYPQSSKFSWNPDFYGPVYIPKKGDEIQLTENNIDLYLKCIQFEVESAERDTSGLKINGEPITTYQFKEDYYFMMGDYRHNSSDSRYWGFLPQRLVIGKAMYLFWGQTRDRIGKEVM